MTDAAIDRVALIEEATAIEKAGGDWKLRHVLAVLGCSRATAYRNKRLMSARIDQPGGAVWRPSEIRLLQAHGVGMKRRAPRRRAS